MSAKAKLLLMVLTLAVSIGILGVFAMTTIFPEQSSSISAALPLFIFFLIAIWVIASYLIVLWLTPIKQLTDFTKEITESRDYTQRIQVKSDREINALANNFNHLLSTIDAEIKTNAEKSQKLLDAQIEMNRMARFDNVTKLPNRNYFMETMERALAKAKREGSHIGIMFFEIEGFKIINDTHGHKVGDALLFSVAKRAQHFMRKGDLVASMGGNEFIVLLNNAPDSVQLCEIASRLANLLTAPYQVDEWEFNININIGIALSDSANYDLSELINNADIAMYNSKVSGPSNYTLFAPHMKQNKRRRLDIANSINDALANNEFCLVYQPKVDVNQNIIGFEALTRWNSPEIGVIAPSEFIPIAEQSGKIYRLTHWLIERVCADLPELINIHGEKLRVSLNLSAFDLNNTKLADSIAKSMKLHAVCGENLELEVTESAYLENFDLANNFFKKMRQLGCTIALDDFGTGYSSLSYLTRIQIDTIKVDKQFIDNLVGSSKSLVITSTIIAMAKQLDLTVCAEGVEKEAQVNTLFDIGCDHIQGFFYGLPKTIQQISADNQQIVAVK